MEHQLNSLSGNVSVDGGGNPSSDKNESSSLLDNLDGNDHLLSEHLSGPLAWIQRQIICGSDPRDVLDGMMPGVTLPSIIDDFMLWKLVYELLTEPEPRKKLDNVNRLEDVVGLLRKSKNVVVLTGAGVSVACGIPDFRSRDGIYARLSKDFPDLPDPQAMFDISYFRKNPRPFYKFAKEIYPGQFVPSLSHRFIAMLEKRKHLLRNYTQNIDTLEQVAGISRLVQCHGSFATASCTNCKLKVNSEVIKADILNQVIPRCPKCPCDVDDTAVMKPDIVFFGENLSNEFYDAMDNDKLKVDLLIVIGSSLKVRPVALIPNLIDPSIPQILINREPLPHFNFDVELLGNCDAIICQLCSMLGDEWMDVVGDFIMPRLGNDYDDKHAAPSEVLGFGQGGNAVHLDEFVDLTLPNAVKPAREINPESFPTEGGAVEGAHDDCPTSLSATAFEGHSSVAGSSHETTHHNSVDSTLGNASNPSGGSCSYADACRHAFDNVAMKGNCEDAILLSSNVAIGLPDDDSPLLLNTALSQATNGRDETKMRDTTCGRTDTTNETVDSRTVESVLGSQPSLYASPRACSSDKSESLSVQRNKRKLSGHHHHKVPKEAKACHAGGEDEQQESELCTETDKVHIDPAAFQAGEFYMFAPPSRYIFHGAELWQEHDDSSGSSTDHSRRGSVEENT